MSTNLLSTPAAVYVADTCRKVIRHNLRSAGHGKWRLRDVARLAGLAPAEAEQRAIEFEIALAGARKAAQQLVAA
ncbi:hypothetical protein ABB55_03320 [Prosthecomicrobium hirschii]|uniref:Uncharacterized protein n=1 Tax=Prosthecodimorpha hirschii TaxID=665126 RepID=A0A0P6VH74_9HYPH|nr:hypothetical protein [Prosthecomicrobium hirschii]KPL51376.1 hypothetical protein ABB55_03320 [Prosthecomicrobium hirschii]